MTRYSTWQAFDGLLRGRIDNIDRVRLIGQWLQIQVVAAGCFGASLGVYSVCSRETADVRFLLSSTIKLPMLLLATTLVTCPSLYVFGALRGLKFTATQFVALLLAAHTIFAGVLASLATVLVFFGCTTENYSFMILLTVFVCALAGGLGLYAFVRSLRAPGGPPVALPSDAAPDEPGADGGDRSTDGVWSVLGWWLILYGFVGLQMSWILRPFVGSPELPWVFLRGRQGSFIEAVLRHLSRILSG